MLRIRWSDFLYLIPVILLLGCNKQEGGLLESPMRAGASILIASNDANNLGITRYSPNGSLQEFIKDYRESIDSYPRGMVILDQNSILVSLDGEDRVERLYYNGSSEIYYASAQLSGNIQGLAKDAAGNIYVLESNRIEKIDANGNRDSSVYIDTTVGGCTINSPRHLIVNSAGHLVVAQTGGGGRIITYDISGSSGSCISSVVFGNSPSALVEHPNGNLYVATLGNDQIYSADADGSNPSVIWSSDTSIINNPAALAVHPDGDLLVASSATDTIEKISTSGLRAGSDPFIRDIFSSNINAMLVIPEDNL